MFKREAVEVIRLPFRAPFANAHSGRWVRTVRRAVLGRMLIFRRRHLGSVLVEFVDHYNQARPHRGIEQRRQCGPAHVVSLPIGPIERRDRLGGIIQRVQSSGLTR